MNTKGKTGKTILISILVILLILAASCTGYWIYVRNLGTFLQNSTLNGYDVSDKTPEEVVSLLKDDFENSTFILTEQGETDLECTLKELGFHLQESEALDIVAWALQMQNKNPIEVINATINKKAYRIEVPFTSDEKAFQTVVTIENLQQPRIKTENAELIQTEEGGYEIIPEVYGTEFQIEDLRSALWELTNAQISERLKNHDSFQSGSAIELSFPEEIYKSPEILSTDSELTVKRDIYNRYCMTKINYQFGSQMKTLDWDTIINWIIFENGSGHMDEAQVSAYVEALAWDYNTRYHERNFQTTSGGTVTIPGNLNEYGYIIDQYAEFAQLMDELSSNTEITREPVYVETNDYGNPYYYAREGTDDLAGTYVEVNLTAQHLWFYVNHSLIVESDFVSGCVANKHETQVGVFPLAYKKSPDILRGQDYNTEVQYWMPFYEGQGLHDAVWRSSFGGNIYQANGSHGCINLPLNAAAAIYNNIQPGMAIVIYK